MIPRKDVEIILHLRNNARKRVTEISRDTKIPATTIYDRVRTHEKSGLIKRYAGLLDFDKLGYPVKTHFAIRVDKDSRKELQSFLQEQPNINSLYKIGYGPDFLFEALFRNFTETEEFVEKLGERFDIKEIQNFHVIEELKKEEFLTKPEHFELP
jgi:Lrp/AsnC family transcriptional regulator, leucine-responsive regulatory protein